MSWELRFEGNNLYAALVTVDGTDYRIFEPIPFHRGWYSHKYKRAGVRYEISVCIATGCIVHTLGPFPCGHWSDISIFRFGVKKLLLPNECVIADKGYRFDEKCLTPLDFTDLQTLHAMSVTRARHEGINGMLKDWKILKDTYRHSLQKHKYVFNAVIVMTQLKLLDGRGTFQVTEFGFMTDPTNLPDISEGMENLQNSDTENLDSADEEMTILERLREMRENPPNNQGEEVDLVQQFRQHRFQNAQKEFSAAEDEEEIPTQLATQDDEETQLV